MNASPLELRLTFTVMWTPCYYLSDMPYKIILNIVLAVSCLTVIHLNRLAFVTEIIIISDDDSGGARNADNNDNHDDDDVS